MGPGSTREANDYPRRRHLETATDDLDTGGYLYDVQLIDADSVLTLTYGKLSVVADVTRAVS